MGTLLIDKLLQTVCTQKASDLHLTVGSQPVIRLHGHMRPLATKVLESADTVALMKSITPERCQQELQEVGGTDFGFAFGDMARFRVAVFKQRGNVGLVLRRIPNEFLTFEQLGLPAVIGDLIQRPRGLILVTGPTGSGKTTSLASMVNWINNNMDRHIITIEDPIEYLPQAQQVARSTSARSASTCPTSRRRSAGPCEWTPTSSWWARCATWRRSRRRSRPPRPATSSSPRCTPTRPRGPSTGSSTSSPRSSRTRSAPSSPSPSSASCAQALLPRKPKGLVAAYEMLVVTPAISNLIRENKTYRIDSSIQTGRKHGMILLDDSLFNLWKQGLVEETEVMHKSRKPNDLRERIENFKKGIFDDEPAEDAEQK